MEMLSDQIIVLLESKGELCKVKIMLLQMFWNI